MIAVAVLAAMMCVGCLVNAAAGVTVQIMTPATDPFSVGADDDPIRFEAIALDEQQEDISDQVTWTWDFGDGMTSSMNPAFHIYAEGGDYTVTATATLGGTTGRFVASAATLDADTGSAQLQVQQAGRDVHGYSITLPSYSCTGDHQVTPAGIANASGHDDSASIAYAWADISGIMDGPISATAWATTKGERLVQHAAAEDTGITVHILNTDTWEMHVLTSGAVTAMPGWGGPQMGAYATHTYTWPVGFPGPVDLDAMQEAPMPAANGYDGYTAWSDSRYVFKDCKIGYRVTSGATAETPKRNLGDPPTSSDVSFKWTVPDGQPEVNLPPAPQG